MEFNRLVIEGGLLVSRQLLRTEEMDADLLDQATEAVAELLQGDASSSVPMPGYPECRVMLGLRRWTPEQVNQMRAALAEHSPEMRIANEQLLSDLTSTALTEHQRTGFHISDGDRRDSYCLVPLDTQDYDHGLFGLVSGSWAFADVEGRAKPFLSATEAERQVFAEERSKVVREITALKPAFIAPAVCSTGASLFGDHFAVAMLLAYEPPANATSKGPRRNRRRNTALRSRGKGRRA